MQVLLDLNCKSTKSAISVHLARFPVTIKGSFGVDLISGYKKTTIAERNGYEATTAGCSN